jgi:hypothetical protein
MAKLTAFIRTYQTGLVAAAVFGLTLCLTSGLAYAAGQDITMTPTSVSPTIKPGSVYRGSFQVIDQGKTSYNFIVYATPYRVNGEAYTPVFTVLPSAPDIASWLNFSTSGAYITPNQAVTVNYTITVPENTQPGGYYAAAFAETQFPKVANSITLNEQVGELFYVDVAGPVVRSGKLLTWQSSFFQKPPLTSTIRLEDSGSINFPVTINLRVKDILGHTKYSLSTIKQLLPQTIRRVTIPWNQTPSIGLFKVTGNVSFLGQTKTLPTRWVLVLSDKVRWTIVAVILLIILSVTVQTKFHKPTRRHKKPRKSWL